MSEYRQDVSGIELSKDGKRNAYYHSCVVTGQHRAYAGCLARIDGRIGGDPNCDTAIGRKSCPALDMRQQEVESGKPIYFVERAKAEEFLTSIKELASNTVEVYKELTESSPKRVVAERKSKVSVPATPKKPITLASALDDSSSVHVPGARIEDTINRQIKDLEVRPGESPIAALRRSLGI